MIGLGTIINAATVIAGGMVGLMLKKGLKQRFQDIITQALGLSVIFIGISGALKEIFTVGQNGTLETQGIMMMVICIALGAIVGEWIGIEKYTEAFGEFLKRKAKSEGDTKFVDGFVNASLTICIGAMAIVGSLQDGLMGDYSMLATKAILDGVILIVFAANYGIGPIFSVIPLVILQGGVTLLARFIEPFMSQKAISDMSLVGSMLIFCIGINLMFKTKLKVANMLPVLIFVLMWGAFIK